MNEKNYPYGKKPKIKSFKERIKDLEDIRRVQGFDGNWNYDPYMHGLYNGIELAHSIVTGEHDPKFKEAPKKWKGVKEDKIMRFNNFKPQKYNGNTLVHDIMEWLRAKLLELGETDVVAVPLSQFLQETNIDENVLKTFINEIDKTQKTDSFKVDIDDQGNIVFSEFKNTDKAMVWEENE